MAATTRSGTLSSYLVQEEDGLSRFILEEGDGFILLAEAPGIVAHVTGSDRPVADVSGGDLGIALTGSDYAVASISGGDMGVASGGGSNVSGADRAIAIVRPT